MYGTFPFDYWDIDYEERRCEQSAIDMNIFCDDPDPKKINAYQLSMSILACRNYRRFLDSGDANPNNQRYRHNYDGSWEWLDGEFDECLALFGWRKNKCARHRLNALNTRPEEHICQEIFDVSEEEAQLLEPLYPMNTVEGLVRIHAKTTRTAGCRLKQAKLLVKVERPNGFVGALGQLSDSECVLRAHDLTIYPNLTFT
jgi:hypothetical protein